MSEWNEHMPYIIQLHIISIRWAYYEQIKQQNIWSVHMTSIGGEKTEAANVYLINNSKGEEGVGRGGTGEGVGRKAVGRTRRSCMDV